MSTYQQKYSIENQAAAIAAYASERKIEIVKTYVDKGRSGLRINSRNDPQKLIADVQERKADFDVILVYDVSRWGRFQDVDESAYYEFIRKKAGIQVLYCAEQFKNDGGFVSAIMKNIRRVAAGDYSRDLSAGVFAGRCRIVTLGFKTGGTPRYGLQRVLIDQFGNERCVLKPGDRKSLHSDRVVLRPGPPKAVKMVQQVFRWFVLERKSELEIARELNERKILNEFGRPWRMLAIRRHLEDEKYLGNYVYNRKSGKLKTPRTPNPENTWVRCNGAFEAIIDPAIFAEAGKIIVGRGGPCAPGSPTAGCWRCSRRGYIQILTIPIQFRIRMADGAWRLCVRRSNVMERQRLLGHPYEEGFDPLADAYRNYSYGTRIWQISCSILRDTIWVVIPRYQAPFIMS